MAAGQKVNSFSERFGFVNRKKDFDFSVEDVNKINTRAGVCWRCPHREQKESARVNLKGLFTFSFSEIFLPRHSTSSVYKNVSVANSGHLWQMWPFSRNGWPLEFSKVARPFPSLKLLKCGHFQLLMKIWPYLGYFHWFWWLFGPFDPIWMLIFIYMLISGAKSQRLTIKFSKRFLVICCICVFFRKVCKNLLIFFKYFHIHQEIVT